MMVPSPRGGMMMTTTTTGSKTTTTYPATGCGQRGEWATDEHVNGRVWGLLLGDTGNGRRQRLRRDGDNDNDVEEGGSHPTTPQMMVTRELAERLRSVRRDWQQAEEGEGNIEDSGDN